MFCFCRCGHEFCYSCGAEYRDSGQTCQCTFWDEEQYPDDVITHPSQEFEQWAWDSFGSLSTMVDAYSEQERSQLALIQRFLAGGLSSGEHQPEQSPPSCTDSYGDSIKDLHQLPWLERFVSVISDNFYDEYNQWSNRGSMIWFHFYRYAKQAIWYSYFLVGRHVNLS